MSLKLTPELQAVDAQLRAVNRKLVTVARVFGTQSQQYGYLESLVLSTYTGKGQTRKNAQGITQVARNAKNVRISALQEEQTIIRKITKQYNIREHKQRLLESWAKKQDPDEWESIINDMTASEKKAVISQQTRFYQALQTGISAALDKIYKKIKRQTPKTRAAVEQMRATSKGRWTDTETLITNLRTLVDSLGHEGKLIAKKFYEQSGVQLPK